MDIKVSINNELEEPEVELWYKDDNGEMWNVGDVKNYMQFLDVSIQVRDIASDRYSFKYLEQYIPIQPTGKINFEDECDGFYTKINELLSILVFGRDKPHST